MTKDYDIIMERLQKVHSEVHAFQDFMQALILARNTGLIPESPKRELRITGVDTRTEIKYVRETGTHYIFEVYHNGERLGEAELRKAVR